MSHAPQTSRARSGLEAYTARWNVLVQLLRQGRSFSGRERNCCFLNTGGTRFADISAASGFDFPEDARAVLPVDWDFDGDLDLIVLNRTAPRLRVLKNQAAVGQRFLAVRLEGTRGNRDAIGARLEVFLGGDQPCRIVRTLRGGEGFASQGSKWVHFGLGSVGQVEKLVVRWPWGETEEFAGVVANSFVVVTQGGKEVRRWQPPDDGRRLAPAAPALPGLPPAIRIAISEGVPMPALRYKNAQGRLLLLEPGDEEGTLVNLWATWCAPCMREISEFARSAETLRAQGLRVLALNVDGLRDEGTMDPAAAESLLDERGFSFERGYATDVLLSQLEILQSPLIESGPAFVMPTSFLVSRSGELLAIYRGPVGIEQLVADLRLAGTGSRGALFPGRWLRPPSYAEYLARVGDALLNEQLPLEAVRYLDLALEELPGQSALIERRNAARGMVEQARSDVRQYTDFIREHGDNVEALARLGVACQILGDQEAAVRHLGRSLALAPDYHHARTALGAALASLGEFAAAQSQFERVLAAMPRNEQASRNLSLLKSKRGSSPETVGAPD